MDLIKIDENKLKIMLTPVDMQSYSLCADELDCTNIETREAFRNIMDEARHRTGFDAVGNQLYVQLYPSKGGGCELFVTKLGLLCEKSGASDRSQKKGSVPRHKQDFFVFSFEKLSHLLFVCGRLHTNGARMESAAYHGEEGYYYLLLWPSAKDSQSRPPDHGTLAFIHEYATPRDANTVRLYIKEHATAVCERGAVETLARL